jgi:HK97 family phage major capsid protein
MEDESLEVNLETTVNYGGEVKALPDGKIGGYLVTFGGLDLTGDYFDSQTDFGEYSKLPVLYHHGFDDKLKTRRIGTAEVRLDDVGLWAEAQLSMRDEYEKLVYEMASKGKLGWSSGAASHVTAREEDTKGMRITQWYMAEASLTPCPAEPRNSVITLKAFLGDSTANKPEDEPEAVKAGSEGEAAESIQPTHIGETKMEITPELQALLDAGAENAVKKFRESEPATKTADIKVTRDEADQPFKSNGEFFMAVKTAGQYPGQIDPRLLPLKAAAGLNESVPSQGGFLVPPELASTILEKTYNTGSLLAQFPRTSVSGNSMTFNVVDETSRADGSRYGGVTGYWLGEAASKTASKPAFRQLELKLKKCAALVYATDELLEDASALESWINRTVPNELRFMVEDAIINGDGIAKPYGILPSAALVSVTRNDAAEVDADDIFTMWSRRYVGYNDYIWLGNQQIFAQLAQLAVANMPVFLPAGGMSGLPYNVLLGRPYFDTEYNPTLGEVGDLLLVSPSAYPMIEKAGGVQSASSIHLNFLTDESVFRFVLRVDGSPSWRTTLTGNDGITYSPFVALTTST